MSVVAWDGKGVAADRLGCCGNLTSIVPKLYPARGYALGFVGTEEVGLMLIDWFDNGAKKSEWPQEAQESEFASSLIVVGRKKVWVCNTFPVFSLNHDPFMAWGSGRDLAMGAMAMGAGAEMAVQITSDHDAGCGGGVDYYPCRELSPEDVLFDVKKKRGKR